MEVKGAGVTVIARRHKQSRSLDRHAALGRLAMTMLATGLNSCNIRAKAFFPLAGNIDSGNVGLFNGAFGEVGVQIAEQDVFDDGGRQGDVMF